MTSNASYTRMLDLAAEIADLESAMSLVGWDQETTMPKKGVDGRAHVSATLAGLAHERLTAPELGDVLSRLRSNGSGLDEEAQAQIDDLWRTYSRAVNIPSELVRRVAETRSRSTAVWAEARAAKNFAQFAPLLTEMVKLQREVAEAIGYRGHPYNALLEEYEPGVSLERIESALDEVKSFLIPFIRAIQGSGKRVDLAPVLGPFDAAAQAEFSREVVQAMGFDLESGRIDTSQHPFCSGIHKGDVRLTARFKDDLRIGLYGMMHEAGHGMYEQGVSDRYRRTPIGSIKSLGIHESQSRLWENNVGLGLSFWKAFYPRLQSRFPGQLRSVPLTAFYAAVNDVRPTFIRIEADEVTYNLHVVIRFEIEKEMIGGNLEVADLPEIWNAKYTEYLGITPPTPDVGVLQDIHWASGLMGYFPTYTLGSINAAQLYAAAGRAIGDLEERIAAGDLSPLKDWLAENVHAWGARFVPDELMRRATGKPTSAQDFIDYIEGKYKPLYGLR